MGDSGRCPVCQARFRGARVCSRCGADLTRLMLLETGAWDLRRAARRALETGDYGTALAAASAAEAMRHTRDGASLYTLALWLKSLRPSRP